MKPHGLEPATLSHLVLKAARSGAVLRTPLAGVLSMLPCGRGLETSVSAVEKSAAPLSTQGLSVSGLDRDDLLLLTLHVWEGASNG